MSVTSSHASEINVASASQIAAAAVADEVSSSRILGYLTLRLCIGLALMLHGVARIFFGNFQPYLAKQMAKFVGGPLPLGLCRAFLLALPTIELLLGFLVVIGLATRYSLFACGLLMASLLFGTCMIQDWTAAEIQLVYAFIIAFLLMNIEWNGWSVDKLRQP